MQNFLNKIIDWINTNTAVFLLIILGFILVGIVISIFSNKRPVKPKRKKARALILMFMLSIGLVGASTAHASSNVFLINGGSYADDPYYSNIFEYTLSSNDANITHVGSQTVADFVYYFQIEQSTFTITTGNGEPVLLSGGNNYNDSLNTTSITFTLNTGKTNITHIQTHSTKQTIASFVEYWQITGAPTSNGKFQLSFDLGPDNTRPAISGNEHFASNVDSPTPVADFISELRAIDNVDGDISHLIKIEKDNYTGKTILGKYDVTVSVTDSAGNKSEFIFWVHLADISNPVVSGDFSKKRISYDKVYDVNAFVQTLVLSDNYYEESELEVVVTKNTYDANKTKLGTYDVEVTVSDPSINETTVGFKIEVFDGVKPIINGITEYTKPYSLIKSVDDIIEGVKASDHIDGDLTDQIEIIEDTFTGKSNVPGVYTIVLQVADTAGNSTTHEIIVTVIDDEGANWYITNGVTFNLPSDTPLSRSQIIQLLSKSGYVQTSANSIVTYTADTYSSNVGNPGIYTLAFQVKEPTGTTNAYQYAINVMSDDNTDDEIIPEEPGFIDNVKDFFSENKTYIIIGAVALILVIALGSKVKEQVKKNKRKRK